MQQSAVAATGLKSGARLIDEDREEMRGEGRRCCTVVATEQSALSANRGKPRRWASSARRLRPRAASPGGADVESGQKAGTTEAGIGLGLAGPGGAEMEDGGPGGTNP